MPSPRNIVPPAAFLAPGMRAPIVNAPAAHLSNHGGPVLQAVQVIPIYWGAAWATGTTATQATQLDGFFDYILTSTMMDMLAEYGTSSTPIQHGSRPRSVHVTATEPGTVSGGVRTVTDAQIQTAIQGWITAGTVPAATANTLYFVFLPPNVVSTQGGSSSCTSYCGYHGHIGSTVFYAVIPYVTCNGCVFPSGMLDTLTEVTSHELCEAITDPTLSTWWDSGTGNEIGDICNRQTTRLGGFMIQTEWSNAAGACVIAPKGGWHHNDLTTAAGAPMAAGDPRSYMFASQGTQHVVYRGTDAHIHELWWDGAWHHNDLTAAAAGAPAAASNPSGYLFDAQNTQHVVYRSADNHVHELWWNGSWNHNDLTTASAAPAAASDPRGYIFAAQGTQHVIYRGADNHVHELWWNGTWHHNDLTTAAGAPSGAGGNPSGYVFVAQNTQHVIYRGADNHVHELWWNGTWHHNDLTAAAAGAPAAASDAQGYIFAAQGTQHVVYRSGDNHVHELWWNGVWNHNDLTAAAKSPVAAGDPCGYMFDTQGTQHVMARGTDGDVHELWWNGAWNTNDLSAVAGFPTGPAGNTFGYVFVAQSTQHVNYRSADGHIHELWWS
jgi:hypothetical protein